MNMRALQSRHSWSNPPLKRLCLFNKGISLKMLLLTAIKLVLLAFTPSFTSASEEMIVFRNTLEKTTNGKQGGAILKVTNDSTEGMIDSMTFCYRFKIKVLGNVQNRPRGMLLNIADWKTDINDKDARHLVIMASWDGMSGLVFGHPKTSTTHTSYLWKNEGGSYDLIRPYVWHHVCYSFAAKGYSRIVLDGEVLATPNKYQDNSLKDLTIPLDLILKIYLLRCPNNYETDCTTPGGQITDFNMWDFALSKDAMIKWTTCSEMTNGNLVNWKTSEWNMENMVAENLSVGEICLLPKPRDVLLPEQRTFPEHLQICNKLGGEATVVKNKAMHKELNEEVRRMIILPKLDLYDYVRYWTGYTDEEEEGQFENVYTGELWSFNSWFPGEPNGDESENCGVALVNYDGLWWDDSCASMAPYGFCNIQARPRIKIRGFPEGLSFDKEYTMASDNITNGHYTFDGYTYTQIHFNKEAELWQMDHLNKPDYATTKSLSIYPFGSHKWLVVTPDYNTTVTLNMNGCDDKISYNCADGSCIDIDLRCDGYYDCKDESDEDKCNKISVPNTYLSYVPAPPSKGQLLADINISVDIVSVLDLIEVDSVMTVIFKLTLRWRDSRVTFRNLKDKSFLNMVGRDDASKIWYPRVIFYNTRNMEETQYDDRTVITIDRTGAPNPTPIRELHNDQTFRGQENVLDLSRMYTTSFICLYQLEMYPFDSQVCSMSFVLQGNSGKFLQLIVSELRYLGPIDLTQYYIKEYTFKNGNETLPASPNGGKPVIIDIVFSRRVMNQILITFLPTACITITSFTTSFYKQNNFEAIVTVNLTSLLVLATMFIGIVNSLPRTAYIKLVDVWLLFNLFMPFIEVMLHTIISMLAEELEQPKPFPKHELIKMAKKVILSFARFGMPAMYLLFCLVFFIYAKAA